MSTTELFDWSLKVFRERRGAAEQVHLGDCALHFHHGYCDCGEPGRQRLMLDAMQKTAAMLNSTATSLRVPKAEREAAAVALRNLLWAFNQEPSYPERTAP